MKTYIYKTPLLCNQKCHFCVTSASYSEKVYRYPEQKFIRECLLIRSQGYHRMSIEGGEPTLITNLPILIRIARKIGLEVSIISNGYCISREYLQTLKNAGVSNITFSIHSHIPNIHDLIVSTKGSFASVVKSIQTALALDIVTSTSSVICKQNQHTLPLLTVFIKSLGVQKISLCCLEANPENQKDYITKFPMFPDLAIIKDAIRKIEGRNIIIDNIPLCAFSEGTQHFSPRFLEYQKSNTESLKIKMDRSSISKIKRSTCNTCIYKDVCEGYLTYFRKEDIGNF